MSLVDGVTSIVSIVQIAAGVLAMGLLGSAAMLARKGSEAHRRWGKTCFWVMAVICGSALLLLALRRERRPNLFLLVIAVLSFYSALAGYRALYRKRPDRGHRPSLLDWGAAIGATAFGLGLAGVSVLAQDDGTERIALPPAVGLAFGFLTAGVAGSDL